MTGTRNRESLHNGDREPSHTAYAESACSFISRCFSELHMREILY